MMNLIENGQDQFFLKYSVYLILIPGSVADLIVLQVMIIIVNVIIIIRTLLENKSIKIYMYLYLIYIVNALWVCLKNIFAEEILLYLLSVVYLTVLNSVKLRNQRWKKILIYVIYGLGFEA